ncbi:DUF2339 domain-containing protein [Salipiger sp.]|uniref:DUF2339 domain-containing protein n=1 Tax=Salipiger sp. TaxID=2078585 RepID=UPI003A974E30
MDALFVVVAVVVLAIPVLVILLSLAVLRLRREMEEVRSELARARLRLTALEPQGAGDAAISPADAAPAAPIPAAGPPAPDRSVAEAMRAAYVRPPGAHTPRSEAPSRAVVFRRERGAALIAWLRENWFYAVSGLSLALAGLFLVQYGIETGLLSPEARVGAALAFGLALIGAGEWIRRRFGDGEQAATAYLPSVFSGAGLVSLMGGIVSARLLYGLIDPGPALIALAATGALALVLGWFHGPLLAAIGIIGSFAAPFLVGGSSESPDWLYLYFAVIAAAGLGIDTLRRWAWVSVLTIALAQLAGWALHAGGAGMTLSWSLYLSALAIMATTIPARALLPDHAGPTLAETLAHRGRSGWPIFPARLSLGTLAASVAMLAVGAADGGPEGFRTVVVLATALTVLFTLWSVRAPALQDHALLPAALLLALIALPPLQGGMPALLRRTLAEREGMTEQPMLMEPTWIMAAALLISGVAAWRALRGGSLGLAPAAAAAVFAPLAGLLLELQWAPSELIGPFPWALHALAVAAAMALMAERFARADPADRARVSLPVLAALACIAFAVSLLLTEAALTLALGALVVAAAALDRRFDLPMMSAAVAGGIVALGYRLVESPGLVWALGPASWTDLLLSCLGTLSALIAALRLLPPARPTARVMLESAVLSVAGLTASVVLHRAIAATAGADEINSHWSLGLHATIWFGLAAAQVERWSLGGRLAILRKALAAVFAFAGLSALVGALVIGNPLISPEVVLGPVLLNTLAPAYLAPALMLALAAARSDHMPRALRLCLTGTALALAAFWAALVIRHGWQGGTRMALWHGTGQPELYSYTVALLATGAALFYQSLARRSALLRRAGLAVIGLAVAKVFLIDISGLQGLTRVFSLLLLGLGLAALAWLNRWAQRRGGPDAGGDAT